MTYAHFMTMNIQIAKFNLAAVFESCSVKLNPSQSFSLYC